MKHMLLVFNHLTLGGQSFFSNMGSELSQLGRWIVTPGPGTNPGFRTLVEGKRSF
jgi:hypothetical protein